VGAKVMKKTRIEKQEARNLLAGTVFSCFFYTFAAFYARKGNKIGIFEFVIDKR
jgi:hypothetical protein